MSRILANHREPDYELLVEGPVDERGWVDARRCSLEDRTNDGALNCGVEPSPAGGGYRWWNGKRSGIEPTFADAWEWLPALVTRPDHFEDRELATWVEVEEV